VVFDGDGSEIDWTVGYDPPAESFQATLQKMLSGKETYKALAASYAKNPKDVAVVFKLAQKWADRYDDAKSAENYKEVVALDPDGKMGTTDYQKEKVSYTELAEFNVGQNALRSRPPAPAPLQAFIKKYKDGTIVRDAYGRLAQAYYGRSASKDEAVKFFDEYTGRYPEELGALNAYVRRIIFDKDGLDKGLQLAQKAVAIAPGSSKTMTLQNLAQIHLLRGDKPKAAEAAEEILKAGSGQGMIMAVPVGEAPPSTPPPADMSAMNAARIFVQADRMDRALAVFGPEYLKKNLDKAQSVSAYAAFWSGQNANLDSALEAAQKAVALTPDAYSGWNNLGQINLKLKKYDDALKAAEKALEIAPAQPPQIKDNIKKTIDQIKAAAQEKK
jgi:tetratricopeptide (TPR) repeat protein